MKFQKVTTAFQAIEHTSSRNHIMVLLAELFHEATPHDAQMLAYLALGQVRPTYLGSQFNIAEKTIKKVIQDILLLADSIFHDQLKNYGDLGTLYAAYPHTTVQREATHSHTLKQVYEQLVALQEIGGEGAQQERALFLRTLLEQLTPAEGGFAIRIILGKLRTGFSDMTMIDALSWMLVGDKSLRKDIEHAYNICADLGMIAHTLKEKGAAGLHDISISVGIPLLPSLAERLPTAAAIVEKLGHCVAQPKLDGFRLQVHIKAGVVHFYSRNLMNMTQMFPELTHAAQQLRVKDAIFEG